ncbi:YetF domain-containing protein [Bacillus sp. 165]|uniref:DUF421 domain-containing protein n=1 Tax=Bacillus sp. 165 TaxID=1529117 RepID=UPI001ADAC69F|nr:YetF domain-containing protein [Bacillus sp. 165]MBO9129012.1 DUF421 domain-containing protein [Bacillus sp. 165]
METIGKSILMVVIGVLFLRFAGRKSIAQMTLAETVVMISIGAIIIQPIVENSVSKTILAIGTFIVTLVILEVLQLKFNPLEKFLTGKAKIVIEEGTICVGNLRKMRMTVDQLEMLLRQQGIINFSSIKIATIEPNGTLGYDLYPDEKPLTVGEFKKLMSQYITQNPLPADKGVTIFQEIKKSTNKHSPKNLK